MSFATHASSNANKPLPPGTNCILNGQPVSSNCPNELHANLPAAIHQIGGAFEQGGIILIGAVAVVGLIILAMVLH